ncbi:unnamed protein product [Cylindrotheca closterium]|uniref:Uncharacterized protein n=1 Tax=Cylindrotheca closterium TaxID=2856 RepID=A0AAD2FZA5_9STRA|nr:unnamed protein product [Cylindrotheca closterium]
MVSAPLRVYQSLRVGTKPLMNSLIVITADCGLTLIFPSPWATSNLRSPTSSHASCLFKTLDPYANIFSWFTKDMPSTPSWRRLNKLNKRIEQLGHQMTPSLVRKYNCLHRQMYTVMRQAEEKCRDLAPGKVPWSPKMQGFWDRMSLWKLLLKGKKGCRVSLRKVRRLMKKTELPQAWRKSEVDLDDCLKQERSMYKQAKRTYAAQWRKNFLTVQTKDAKKHQWKSRKARDRFFRLRQMKQREEARRRRRAQSKGSTGGLQAIQIEEHLPDGTTSLWTITDRRLVKDGCMQENTAHYDQTRALYTTPPMAKPLYSEFTGDSAESNSLALLEGRYT